MPLITPAVGFGRSFQQTAKGGVTITGSGTAHTKGNWATLIDPLSYDAHGVFLNAGTVAITNTDTRMLLDLGIATTGGGDEQVVIPNIDMGAAAPITGSGKVYFFPLHIPAGKALRARCQAVQLSDTVLVAAHVYSLPFHGYSEDSPQEWETYGADTSASRGVAVTSGSGTYGTDVQITASTTRDHRWFHVSIGNGTNTAQTSGRFRVRLARDTAAADIIGIWEFQCTANEEIVGPWNCIPACYPVAAGSALRVDIDGAAAEAMTAIVHAA